MAERRKITLKDVRSLAPDEEVWDSAVAGFGARRQKSPVVAYVVMYRTRDGRQRRVTIGRHGAPWTPDTAREEAKRLLGDVARGDDPAAAKSARRRAETVADLCEQYFADASAGRLLTRRKEAKKPSTLATDKGRIDRHIVPLMGRLAVAAVTREDVEGFMHAVADGKTAGRTKSAKKHGLARVTGGKGTASRTVGLLGAIFSYAVRRRMRADNPAAGVERYADGRRLRRLADAEYGVLAAALAKGAEAQIWPPALAAARFLAYSGWRSGEALALTWADVDLPRRTATFESKTGRTVRALSHRACDVLAGMTNVGGFVFPGSQGEGRMMTGFPKFWARIAKLGSLSDDVTPHVLRHSFASLASDLGYSEPTIATLVGHKGRSMTSRYVHSADGVLLAAADKIADRITELMGIAREDAKVVSISRRSVRP